LFGSHFYHERIRKSVATFGSLFNNLYVVRQDASGGVLNQQKVPLAYAPRMKYLERIREQQDLATDQKVALKLPRISFEMTSIQYDSTRMTSKTNKFNAYDTDTNKKVFYAGVPYNLYFDLNIYANTQEDALQIVEQIIPYFAPQYTLTLKPFNAYPTIKEDVPITIVSSAFTDDFEGPVDVRRTIIYTLSFEMKVMFYGPIGDASIIRSVQTNYFLMGDSDGPVTEITTVPNPLDVDPDSDYGFTTTKVDYIG